MKLLLKLTELVDKDIAATDGAISLFVVIVPWLPFMLFVDGEPEVTHPVLFRLAQAVSIAWVLFLLWRVARHLKKEFAPDYKSLGPAWFWALMALAIGVAAALQLWRQK